MQGFCIAEGRDIARLYIYPGREGLIAEIMTRSKNVCKLIPLEKYLLLGTEKGNLKYSLLHYTSCMITLRCLE